MKTLRSVLAGDELLLVDPGSWCRHSRLVKNRSLARAGRHGGRLADGLGTVDGRRGLTLAASRRARSKAPSEVRLHRQRLLRRHVRSHGDGA